MKRQIISARLRQPSGVFSHATTIEAKGRLVFVSGMVARRAAETIAGVGDIEAQTHQVYENVTVALAAARGTMDDICRVDVYVRSMEHFDTIHRSAASTSSPSSPVDGGSHQDDPPGLPDRDERDRVVPE